MAGLHSYTITLDNVSSEKEALNYLVNTYKNFICPDKDSRKVIMDFLNIDKRYSRAFDLILVPGQTSLDKIISLNRPEDVVLIELKTTKKKLENNPKGFFFGATENEFDLARLLGKQFRFCFVSLHPESLSYKLLTLSEMEKLIQRKRIQYQINLIS